MEFSLPKRVEISNKSTYGRVLNISGSDYMPGAGYLSSVSALKIGCGYCFLLTTKDARNAIASQTQNVVFVKDKDIKKYCLEADVIEIGCGLGQNLYARDIFSKFLKYAPDDTPVVVDADALNLISKNPKIFLKKKFQEVVFTPHPLEAARLLHVDSILENIVEAAKFISEKYNCITVLKCHETLVYSPDGRMYKNSTGNNSMAKAGSGDVLTGMISGLVAQGMDIFEASCLGVYLHGACGDLAKDKFTEYCVMADDLISYIPEAIKLI